MGGIGEVGPGVSVLLGRPRWMGEQETSTILGTIREYPEFSSVLIFNIKKSTFISLTITKIHFSFLNSKTGQITSPKPCILPP
jgi:hypothetical protein